MDAARRSRARRRRCPPRSRAGSAAGIVAACRATRSTAERLRRRRAVGPSARRFAARARVRRSRAAPGRARPVTGDDSGAPCRRAPERAAAPAPGNAPAGRRSCRSVDGRDRRRSTPRSAPRGDRPQAPAGPPDRCAPAPGSGEPARRSSGIRLASSPSSVTPMNRSATDQALATPGCSRAGR